MKYVLFVAALLMVGCAQKPCPPPTEPLGSTGITLSVSRAVDLVSVGNGKYEKRVSYIVAEDMNDFHCNFFSYSNGRTTENSDTRCKKAPPTVTASTYAGALAAYAKKYPGMMDDTGVSSSGDILFHVNSQ